MDGIKKCIKRWSENRTIEVMQRFVSLALLDGEKKKMFKKDDISFKSVENCGTLREGLSVVKTAQNPHEMGVIGMFQSNQNHCGSVSLCPKCSTKKNMERAELIEKIANSKKWAGMWMLTLTAPHDKKTDPYIFRLNLHKAFNKFVGSRQGRKIFGSDDVAWYRNWDWTFSFSNNDHYHFHVAIFSENNIDFEKLRELWVHWIKKYDLCTTNAAASDIWEHSFNVEEFSKDKKNLGGYICKSLGLEIFGVKNKSGRDNHYNVWDILKIMIKSDEDYKKWLPIFLHYAEFTKGLRSRSSKLFKILAEKILSEEEEKENFLKTVCAISTFHQKFLIENLLKDDFKNLVVSGADDDCINKWFLKNGFDGGDIIYHNDAVELDKFYSGEKCDKKIVDGILKKWDLKSLDFKSENLTKDERVTAFVKSYRDSKFDIDVYNFVDKIFAGGGGLLGNIGSYISGVMAAHDFGSVDAAKIKKIIEKRRRYKIKNKNWEQLRLNF